MKVRAVIYCRCSTEEESQKDALVHQVEEARELVHRQGWDLVDSYVESRSGTSIKGRAEYSRLWEDIGKNQFDVIVIKSQDRLMRNTRDWYLFIDRLTVFGKRLYIYLEQKFYSADDALLTGIKAILAEDYSRELSKKINHAHQNRQKKNGAVILTSNTYGYRKLPDKSVMIVEEEARIKRKMYQLCAAGYGSRRIAAVLQEEGVVNRRGNPFSASDIRRMIRNPINKGTVVMNKVHYDFDSKRKEKVPESQQYIYENKIPALVSSALWEAANREIDKRAGKLQANRRGIWSGSHPFSGKLVCGICHAPYYRTTSGNADLHKSHEWKCRSYLEGGRTGEREKTRQEKQSQCSRGCENIHLKEGQFMEVLISGLEDGDTPDKEYLFQRMKELLSALWKERKSPGSEKEAEKELKQLQEKRELLVDKLLEGVLTDEMYQAKQMQLEQRQKEIRMQLEEKKKNESQNMEADRMTKIESYLWTQGISQAVLACFLEEIEKIVIYPGYMEVFFSDGKLGGLRRAANGMKISNNKLRIAYGTAFRYRERKQEEREKILILMRENPEITARQIAEIQKVSMSAVNYRIRILKKENRVRFCGKGGKGHWEVLDPVF